MSFVSMAEVTMIGTVILVFVALGIYEAYIRLQERRQKQALEYVLRKTKSYYFYGQRLDWCLRAGIAWELYWYDVGDFARQLGALLLCALDGTDKEPRMYYYVQEEIEEFNDHYVGIIRFFYGNKWWQFSLLQELNEDNLRPARNLDKELESCEYMTYWRLTQEQRERLMACREPGKSDLSPDARYERPRTEADPSPEPESEEQFLIRAHYEVDHIVSFWVFRHDGLIDENGNPIERKPKNG